MNKFKTMPYSIAILILLAIIQTGCVTKTGYTIKFQYVNPRNANDEVRMVEGEVSGSGITKSTVLVEFPRTLKTLNDEYIWRFKK